MLIFGHAGLTMAAAVLTQSLGRGGDGRKHPYLSWFADNAARIDFRLVLIGALLPDIVDKPIWLVSASGFQWDGRGYAHSLLFNLALLLLGTAVAAKWKRLWLIVLALCSLGHLVLDQMWLLPNTLWWPLLGGIARESTRGWLSGMLANVLSNPAVWIPELAGFVVIVTAAARIAMDHGLSEFLKSGRMGLRRPKASKGTSQP